MLNRAGVFRRTVPRVVETALALAAVALGIWLVASLRARATAGESEQTCRSNMRAIYRAIQLYQEDNGGNYPPLLVERDRQEQIPALVPNYLNDPRRVVCPADPRGGQQGWVYPCSYQYQLQELSFRNPEVRRRVKTELIERYGPQLRLLVCSSLHPGHPPLRFFLTMRADGVLGWERIPTGDPQASLRTSLWKLEDAYHESRVSTPGAPAAAAPAPQSRKGGPS